ncbi:glycine oxidase ThiO [Rossellomorea marisflavi]|uniref:glycine oxidase ThiO n=1 Tax=Rossellomorea marisflavi TaxID=189381 RepID=UPI0011E657D8|nr:glycine oxidase ThiO [Rossellomorea marisflavi]TYO72668.1 glycine oxidase ThiO [Rossellomorea marisflavi]
MKRIIIVGGGVIGLSIAFELMKKGCNVTLLEKGKLAGKASGAAAGMLGVHTETRGNPSMTSLAKESRDLFPALAEQLLNCSGIDIGLRQNGMIMPAMTGREQHLLQEEANSPQGMKEELCWLEERELRKMEPSLSRSFIGGLYIPRDGNLLAPRLSEALAISAATMGAVLHEGTEVNTLIMKGRSVIGVNTTRGPLYGDEVVVAGGAWSQHILRRVGIKLDAAPVKGECISVTPKEGFLNRTIVSDDVYLVPKADGTLTIGATEQVGSFSEDVAAESVSRLLAKACTIAPGIAAAAWGKAWAGTRPKTSSRLPFMGRVPDVEGMSLATGHYRNGILLAPITGVLMADLLSDKDCERRLGYEYTRQWDRNRGSTSSEVSR